MTSDERRELRSEVKLSQSIQRAQGERVMGIHDTERALSQQRVQEALEKARPTFLSDGHGLRGPQLPVAPMIDGVDGWGSNFQVKHRTDRTGSDAITPSGSVVLPSLTIVTIVQDAGTGAFTQETVKAKAEIV